MVSSSLILMRDVKIVSVGMVPYNVRGNSVIFLTAGTQYIHQGLAVLCVQVWLGSLFLFVHVFEKISLIYSTVQPVLSKHLRDSQNVLV